MSLITSDVREFKWLTRYLVTKADMLSFQTWLQAWGSIAAQQTGLQGVIISGLELAVTSPLAGKTTFTVQAGFGTDQTGKPLILNAQTVLDNIATYSNNIKGILVLKFLGTNATPTTTPVESGNLHTMFGSVLELVMGTAAASPTYPAITNGLILGGFTFNSSGILTAEDYSIASFPRMGIKGNAYLTNSTTHPTVIPIGTQLVHYNISMQANLTNNGLIVTGGDFDTNGFVLNNTGTIVNNI